MAWFGKRPRSTFPADTFKRLEMFGRFEFDPFNSGIDNPNIYNDCVIPYFAGAKADPDGFFAELAAVIAGDEGGFATFGAARLCWELFDSDVVRMPAALPFIDAGIDFKLARGLSTGHLTGYEHERLLQRREQGY